MDDIDIDDHWPARDPKHQARYNPLIDTEAGVNGDANTDGADWDADHLDRFIVDADVC